MRFLAPVLIAGVAAALATTSAVGQRPDWIHAQVHFDRSPAPALRPRVARTQALVGVR